MFGEKGAVCLYHKHPGGDYKFYAVGESHLGSVVDYIKSAPGGQVLIYLKNGSVLEYWGIPYQLFRPSVPCNPVEEVL